MTYDKTYWRVVGIALLPALALSIAAVLMGALIGIPDAVVNHVSQLLFFPTFLGMCYYLRQRRSQPADSAHSLPK